MILSFCKLFYKNYNLIQTNREFLDGQPLPSNNVDVDVGNFFSQSNG